jgi:hypothetical protein
MAAARRRTVFPLAQVAGTVRCASKTEDEYQTNIYMEERK